MTKPFTLSRRSVLCVPFALAACKRSAPVVELTGQTMGTGYSVVAVDQTRSVSRTELDRAVRSALAVVNSQMSNWQSGSEISRLNDASTTGPLRVSTDLAKVLRAASQINTASDGRFDISLGPLIETWGFGAAGPIGHAPSDAAIETALDRMGQVYTHVSAASAVEKSKPGTQVYLSGIGKGHGVDRVAATLRGFGITDYLVEIGGDLVTSGTNPDGGPWRIGIETPDEANRSVQTVVGVSGVGVATSGDYRNYFERAGVRYSHILDPRTGRPVTHRTASATVLDSDAMLADAWSTAMLTLGSKRGLEVAEDQDLAVLFIDRGAENQFVTRPSSRFDRHTG